MPPLDMATHQHMTTYTIGLGVNGTLAYDPNYLNQTSGAYVDLKNGTTNWPVPQATSSGGDARNIDDLWHAAVNGRGRYFATSNANTLSNGASKRAVRCEPRRSALRRVRRPTRWSRCSATTTTPSSPPTRPSNGRATSRPIRSMQRPATIDDQHDRLVGPGATRGVGRGQPQHQVHAPDDQGFDDLRLRQPRRSEATAGTSQTCAARRRRRSSAGRRSMRAQVARPTMAPTWSTSCAATSTYEAETNRRTRCTASASSSWATSSMRRRCT